MTLGRRVYSRLDVDALRSLSRINIDATTLTLNDDDIQWIQRRVQHHLQAVQQKDSKTRWIDEGYWLTFPIAAIVHFGSARDGLSAGPQPLRSSSFFLRRASSFSWLDLWMTHDQQGRYYFQKADYKKAAEKFDDPLWRGFALARAGDYDAALNAFALSESAESWYNQGDALAHLGKYPEAVSLSTGARLGPHGPKPRRISRWCNR